MKGKKLVSVLTAGALAATMAMPVFAADGGEVNVDVTTKTGILRVEVPTTLAVAVDQFETTTTGTQIHSEEFKIANKSEVNVKVNVTSTATVKDSVALAAKRGDVATATAAGGTAWLAVAAKKSASNYEASSGNDTFANLNEAAENVTTFAKNGTATTAAQTFYLKKGTAGSAAYKALKPTADGKDNDVSYAQFYKLTELSTQPSDDTTLQTAVNANDVYVIASADLTAPNGKTVTKIAKGETITSTWASGDKYYTMADTATSKADLKAADIYIYGELTKDASGADAAFRYIGELSPNKALWDATDISHINIAYTIQGLPQSTYDDATGDGMVYGLYKEKIPAVYMELNGGYWISPDGKGGFAAAPTSLTIGGTASTDYTFESGGWIKLKNKPADGADILLIVNGTTYKATVPTP